MQDETDHFGLSAPPLPKKVTIIYGHSLIALATVRQGCHWAFFKNSKKRDPKTQANFFQKLKHFVQKLKKISEN